MCYFWSCYCGFCSWHRTPLTWLEPTGYEIDTFKHTPGSIDEMSRMESHVGEDRMERNQNYGTAMIICYQGQAMLLWGAWLGRSSEHQIFDKSSSSCQLGMPSSFAYAWVCSTPVSSVIPAMPQPRRIPFVSLDDTFFAALLSIQFFRTCSPINLL